MTKTTFKTKFKNCCLWYTAKSHMELKYRLFLTRKCLCYSAKCCIAPIFNFRPSVETMTKCFCSMIFYQKWMEMKKKSLKFLLLMSIMYQGCEVNHVSGMKVTVLSLLSCPHEANCHFDRAKLGNVACPLGLRKCNRKEWLYLLKSSHSFFINYLYPVLQNVLLSCFQHWILCRHSAVTLSAIFSTTKTLSHFPGSGDDVGSQKNKQKSNLVTGDVTTQPEMYAEDRSHALLVLQISPSTLSYLGSPTDIRWNRGFKYCNCARK